MIDHTALWKCLRDGRGRADYRRRPLAFLPGTRLFIEEPTIARDSVLYDDNAREEVRAAMSADDFKEWENRNNVPGQAEGPSCAPRASEGGPRPRVGVPFSQGEP